MKMSLTDEVYNNLIKTSDCTMFYASYPEIGIQNWNLFHEGW